MRSPTPIAALLAAMLLSVAPTALAGGLEYTGQGAQSLARGGAVAARAEDPMVLAHNPAGLAELRGSQFLLNLNISLFDACVDPIGFYGWGVYLGGLPARLTDPNTGEVEDIPLGTFVTDPETGMMVLDGDGNPIPAETQYYEEPYDTVCLDQAITPVPQIAWSHRLSERVGIGAGLIFPPVQPSGSYGGRNGIIRGRSGELRPAPTRYMMLSSNNLGVFPTLGVGYRILPQLRVGLAVEWGIIAIDNYTIAGAQGGTSPQNDIRAHVKAQDYFVPGFTASVHAVPMDELDLVLAFRFQDDVRASGDIDLTTGLYDPTRVPHTTGNIEISKVEQNMPWKVRLGARYASRFAPRPGGTGDDEADPFNHKVIHDPLQDERWDLELDVEFQANSRNQEQVIEYGESVMLIFQPADPMQMEMFTEFPNPSEPTTIIEKRWKDQVSVRAGGTYNLMPGVIGVSGGAHFETRGIDPAYTQIDFWPHARFGLHTGVIVRVANSLDFVVSYAHIFQETLVVSAPTHGERTQIDLARADGSPVTQIDKSVGTLVTREVPPPLEEVPPSSPDGEARFDQNISRTAGGFPPYIVNAGRYRSSFDIIAVGMNVHF